nr:amino acid permease [uncultured Cellulosilyticum sp.]
MEKKEKIPSQTLKRELGLGAATAIVVGNMMGSGIFTSPQTLAQVANPYTNMWAWVITGTGSVMLALSFANLGTLYPETGGPIVYVDKAYGKFMAFLVAWTFWIGSWIGNAAIITAIIRYVTVFFPGIATNNLVSFLISSGILWLFTFINCLGVKQAGYIGIISTILKLAVIVVFVIVAIIGFEPTYLKTYSSESVRGLSSLPAAIAVTLWSFIGLESASISGGEIKNPEVNIKKSTFLGTAFVAVIYLVISILAMGSLPQGELAASSAPLATIINQITGATWGGGFIALGIIISATGALSGWVLTTARLSFAAGEDGIFPNFFAKVHPRYQTPYTSLIITGICTNLILILNYVSTLTAAFDFMVNLATLSFIPAYALTTGAEIILTLKHKPAHIGGFIWKNIRQLLAFAYTIYIIYGSGAESAMWVFILMFVGIPFYIYQQVSTEHMA